MKEQLSQDGSAAYTRGLHHGRNGGAPRVGRTVEIGNTLTDATQREAFFEGVRHGWNEKNNPTPIR